MWWTNLSKIALEIFEETKVPTTFAERLACSGIQLRATGGCKTNMGRERERRIPTSHSIDTPLPFSPRLSSATREFHMRARTRVHPVTPRRRDARGGFVAAAEVRDPLRARESDSIRETPAGGTDRPREADRERVSRCIGRDVRLTKTETIFPRRNKNNHSSECLFDTRC